ncbi:hypothetical protein GEV33_009418 [Tenebrio molitor]|uniref:Uncharacterized protein n=1 Tax=Tenebrio molitor TaxID=7067 RepID=A0A8J6HFD4_TENMO|nr:hypothetical protein GEV33_009418 [Tenebrio molitor]
MNSCARCAFGVRAPAGRRRQQAASPQHSTDAAVRLQDDPREGRGWQETLLRGLLLLLLLHGTRRWNFVASQDPNGSDSPFLLSRRGKNLQEFAEALVNARDNEISTVNRPTLAGTILLQSERLECGGGIGAATPSCTACLDLLPFDMLRHMPGHCANTQCRCFQ